MYINLKIIILKETRPKSVHTRFPVIQNSKECNPNCSDKTQIVVCPRERVE